MRVAAVSILAMSLALSGCGALVHTDPPAMEGMAAQPEAEKDVSEHAWWGELNDSTLEAMVSSALAEGLTTQAASARIAAAQAALEGQGVSSSISGSLAAQARRSGSDVGATSDTKSMGLGPSIVIDLFGARKEARDRALAQLQASELDAGTAQLSVISGVVSSYTQARYQQEAIKVTRGMVEKRRETTEMTQEKTRLGAASELSAAQARVTLEQAEKDLSDLETSYRNTVYALATLMAMPAEEALDMMKAPKPIPRLTSGAAKVPANLLRNRPDVRSKEQSVLAAAASVGVAKAQLYPSLSLSGNISASADVKSWSFGPSLSLPVLNQPSLRANVRAAEASLEEAHIGWKSAVLSAVEDVNVGLNTYEGAKRAVSTAREVFDAQKRVVELTEFSYEAGSNTMMDVLEARQELDSAQIGVLSAQRDQVQAWSELQIAAGRGWAAH